MTLADLLVVMNAGRVEQIGPPLEIYERPATTFVATFIGAPPMNLIHVTASEAVELSSGGPLPEGGEIGRAHGCTPVTPISPMASSAFGQKDGRRDFWS